MSDMSPYVNVTLPEARRCASFDRDRVTAQPWHGHGWPRLHGHTVKSRSATVSRLTVTVEPCDRR